MAQENVNNAPFAKQAINSVSGLRSVKTPDKVETGKTPVAKPDFSEAPKGPAVIGSKSLKQNSEIQLGLQTAQDKLSDLDIGFGYDDDDLEHVTMKTVAQADKAQLSKALTNNQELRSEGGSVDFALADDDLMSILTDRIDPMSENYRISEAAILDLETFSDELDA